MDTSLAFGPLHLPGNLVGGAQGHDLSFGFGPGLMRSSLPGHSGRLPSSKAGFWINNTTSPWVRCKRLISLPQTSLGILSQQSIWRSAEANQEDAPELNDDYCSGHRPSFPGRRNTNLSRYLFRFAPTFLVLLKIPWPDNLLRHQFSASLVQQLNGHHHGSHEVSRSTIGEAI